MNTELPPDDNTALTVAVDSTDVSGTVFVIPLDSPLPNELVGIAIPTGSLYDRLVNLAHPSSTEFSFVPLSGQEMILLERAWASLTVAKKVAVLTELPGARYDILFTQARRQIGLRSIDWPSVATALVSRVTAVQRTIDKTPWDLQNGVDLPTRSNPLRGPRGSNLPKADTSLVSPEPAAEDDDL